MEAPLTVGTRCELLSSGPSGSLRASIKRYGEIAYVGAIEGLPGDGWLGVRLDKPLGKGDGSFQGTRYFDCKPLHGAIVRPERVNTRGEFPILATHEESLAHALEERRKEKQGARSALRGGADDVSALQRELTTDELATAFWNSFTQQEERVRKQVGLFCEQKKQPVPCELAKEVKLDALVLEINAMRDAAATASSLYLSPYDTRHTQLILSKLLELIDATRAAFAPRKKFTFRAHAARRAKAKATHKQEQPEQDALAESAGNQLSPSTTLKAMEFDELVHANKKNEVIVIDSCTFADADDSKRRDLNFSHLTNCVVLVCVETSAIRGDALKNCVFYTGAIFGSMWLENCHGCEFFVACRQLRVHLSTTTTFHLRIPSHPIIEDCQQMQFGPYLLQFDGLKAQLERLGVSKDSGMWAKVNDFKWHKALQSPNWSIHDQKQPLPKIPAELEKLVSYE